MAGAADFTVVLDAKLKDGALDAIRRQINNLQDEYNIDIRANTNDLTKDVKAAKRQLKSLDNMDIDFGESLLGDMSRINNSLRLLRYSIDDIRHAIGSIDDGNGMNSILASINKVGTALDDVAMQFKSLSSMMDGANFNFNIDFGLGKNNPISNNAAYSRKVQQETLPQLRRQVQDLVDFYNKELNKTGNKALDANALLGMVGGTSLNNGDFWGELDRIQTGMGSKSKSEQMSAYKSYIDWFKNAAEIKGIDLSPVTSQWSKSADEMINDAVRIQDGTAQMEENFSKLKSIFGGGLGEIDLSGIISQLDSISQKLDGIGKNTDFSNIISSLDSVANKLEEVAVAMDKMYSSGKVNASGISSPLEQTENAAQELATQANAANKALDSISGSGINNVASSFENAASSAKEFVDNAREAGKIVAKTNPNVVGDGGALYDRELYPNEVKDGEGYAVSRDRISGESKGLSFRDADEAFDYLVNYGLIDENGLEAPLKNTPHLAPTDDNIMGLFGSAVGLEKTIATLESDKAMHPAEVAEAQAQFFERLDEFRDLYPKYEAEVENKKNKIQDDIDLIDSDIKDIEHDLKDASLQKGENADKKKKLEEKKKKKVEEKKRKLEDIANIDAAKRQVDTFLHRSVLKARDELALRDARFEDAFNNKMLKNAADDYIDSQRRIAEARQGIASSVVDTPIWNEYQKNLQKAIKDSENAQERMAKIEENGYRLSEETQRKIDKAKAKQEHKTGIADAKAETKSQADVLREYKSLLSDIQREEADFRKARAKGESQTVLDGIRQGINDKVGRLAQIEVEFDFNESQLNEIKQKKKELEAKDIVIDARIEDAKIKSSLDKLISVNEKMDKLRIERIGKEGTEEFEKIQTRMMDLKQDAAALENVLGLYDDKTHGVLNDEQWLRYSDATWKSTQKVEQAISKHKDSMNKADVELKRLKKSFLSSLDIFEKRNTKAMGMSKYADQIARLRKEADKCGDIDGLKRLKNDFNQLNLDMKAEGLEGLTTFDKLKNKFSEYATYAVASMGIMEIVQGLQAMAREVVAVDTAMTGLMRVTEMTGEQYDRIYDGMIASSKEYGRTLTDTINATADWVRAGFDANEALGLAEVTAMYQNVSDLDYDEAAENLLTSYNGFKEQLLSNYENDAVAANMHITDVLNELDNKFSVTSAGLGEGLARSASALQLAGNTFEESAA